jgi:hypothetical protein
MRAHRFMLGFIPGILLTVGSVQAAFAEEYRGTMEQQMACTPDVWRLCGDQIPDVNRIVACLQRNTPNLSGACRAVFESNNSAPPSQAAPPPSRGHAALPPPARIAPPPRPSEERARPIAALRSYGGRYLPAAKAPFQMRSERNRDVLAPRLGCDLDIERQALG